MFSKAYAVPEEFINKIHDICGEKTVECNRIRFIAEESMQIKSEIKDHSDGYQTERILRSTYEFALGFSSRDFFESLDLSNNYRFKCRGVMIPRDIEERYSWMTIIYFSYEASFESFCEYAESFLKDFSAALNPLDTEEYRIFSKFEKDSETFGRLKQIKWS